MSANKSRVERDADSLVRSKIPTIREIDASVELQKSSTIEYYQISGTGALAIGKLWEGIPNSITFTNTHASLAPTLDFKITRTLAQTTFYLLKNVTIPVGSSFKLEKEDLAIEDGVLGYTAQLASGGTPTMDIRVKL